MFWGRLGRVLSMQLVKVQEGMWVQLGWRLGTLEYIHIDTEQVLVPSPFTHRVHQKKSVKKVH